MLNQQKVAAPSSLFYTLNKYVRKGKNMPAGAVRVEREAVILVDPRGLSQLVSRYGRLRTGHLL